MYIFLNSTKKSAIFDIILRVKGLQQAVFFPTGLRVLPAGNLQISQEILLKIPLWEKIKHLSKENIRIFGAISQEILFENRATRRK